MVSLFFFGRRGEGDDCGFVELTLCSLLQKREGDRRRSGSGEEGGRRERYYRRLAAGNGCTDGLGYRSMAFVLGERKGGNVQLFCLKRLWDKLRMASSHWDEALFTR